MAKLRTKKILTLSLITLIGIAIWNLNPPHGVSVQAMHMLAIFIFTVLGIILRPLSTGTVALIGLTLIVSTKTLSFGDAFSGFVNPIVWLIVFAFFISRGFIKTGLGERLAYLIIKYQLVM